MVERRKESRDRVDSVRAGRRGADPSGKTCTASERERDRCGGGGIMAARRRAGDGEEERESSASRVGRSAKAPCGA